MKTDLHKILKSNKEVLFQFYAIWSAECDRIFDLLKNQNSIIDGRISLVRVNINKQKKITQTFNVNAIPTLILFRNGELIKRHDGPIAKLDLSEMINIEKLNILETNQLLNHKN